jgi:hypothetical protein
MTKPTITKRSVKGSPLTYSELDTNFDNLRDATVSLQAGTGGTSVSSDLNGVITLVAGSNITLTGDNTAKTITIAATGGASDIVNDTTPQLGGNLDVNGNSIVSVSNGNIVLAPNGNGTVIIKGGALSTLALGDSAVSTIVRVGIAAGVTDFSLADGVNSIEFNQTTGMVLDTDPGRDIKISAGSGDDIELDGALKIRSTTGTPTTFENGYYEDMLQTPVAWLKISIGGSFYYLPLYQ